MLFSISWKECSFLYFSSYCAIGAGLPRVASRRVCELRINKAVKIVFQQPRVIRLLACYAA